MHCPFPRESPDASLVKHSATKQEEHIAEVPETKLQIHPELKNLLSELIRRKGSDLHLQIGEPPLIRVDGKLNRLKASRLTPDECRVMLRSIMNEKQRNHFRKHLELDLSCELTDQARFRVNVFQQRSRLGSVFRLIPMRIKSIDILGLPPILKKLALLPRGFVLITGPTGSGKSTTLAAMIDHLNQNNRRHIITIEDPIEFSFEDKQCLVEQREVEVDTHSFASALQHIMRQNPDVIMVGEMRDLETITLALSAAEMGSLVMATLHTRSAYHTVDRIIDVFPSEQQQQVRLQLASGLSAVISQILIPAAEGFGRIPATEIMLCNAAIRNAIREGKPQQIPSLIQAGQESGMQMMDKSLADLAIQKKVRFKDALAKSADPVYLQKLVKDHNIR